MPKSGRTTAEKAVKKWPETCLWPMPTAGGDGFTWGAEDAESMPLDEEGRDLLDIKEYMDELVEEGRLNEDYTLNPDYEEWDNEDSLEDGEGAEDWEPEKGEQYWYDGRFNIDEWDEDISVHLNGLKLPLPSPVDDIQRIIGYEFVNENLLRQAFTRRAFGIEHGVGDSEVLELIGDSVLNTIVTREISKQLTSVEMDYPREPFRSQHDEGELTRIRQHYVCKEFLSERAVALGLDKYILYGSGEQPSERTREDMIEALIGAVAEDCEWDWHVLEGVVDQLLVLQFSEPKRFLFPNYYDLFNSWHQRKFGKLPEYELSAGHTIRPSCEDYQYTCTLRYFVPNNDKGIWTSQRVDVRETSRSKARERAAEKAYSFVVNNGLWMDLRDAELEPDLEKSINQLQELYQKKYVEQPEYSFEERDNLGTGSEWYCTCSCSGIEGWGIAAGKVKAKKKAAFMVLVRLLDSAGLATNGMKEAVWKTLETVGIETCTAERGAK